MQKTCHAIVTAQALRASLDGDGQRDRSFSWTPGGLLDVALRVRMKIIQHQHTHTRTGREEEGGEGDEEEEEEGERAWTDLPVALQRDWDSAVIVLQEAMNQGHGGAAAELGVSYHFGQGLPVNHVRARALYEKAYTQNTRTRTRTHTRHHTPTHTHTPTPTHRPLTPAETTLPLQSDRRRPLS